MSGRVCDFREKPCSFIQKHIAIPFSSKLSYWETFSGSRIQSVKPQSKLLGPCYLAHDHAFQQCSSRGSVQASLTESEMGNIKEDRHQRTNRSGGAYENASKTHLGRSPSGHSSEHPSSPGAIGFRSLIQLDLGKPSSTELMYERRQPCPFVEMWATLILGTVSVRVEESCGGIRSSTRRSL